ncbi:MAG: GapR family DNA-binding domain-containing protein [Novosphingobium sp.]
MSQDPLDGRRDPSSGHSKDLLIGFIRAVKDLREQVRELNADKAEVKKSARDAGFDGVKIEEVVRWMEKCDKHGRDVMDESEALYDLYRGVIDGKGLDFDEIMDDARDRALLKIFAPDDQSAPKAPTQKQQAANTALAYAAVSKMNRGS